jgi:hypothetical protein
MQGKKEGEAEEAEAETEEAEEEDDDSGSDTSSMASVAYVSLDESWMPCIANLRFQEIHRPLGPPIDGSKLRDLYEAAQLIPEIGADMAFLSRCAVCPHA